MADVVKGAIGVTRNLGNFNSFRLDVGWETQVAKDETVDEAFLRLWTKIEKELEDKAAEYEEDE